MNEENLINYYNKFNEDKRLTRRHGIVEFNTTIKYIKDYLKKDSVIADIGCGTGAYSLYLNNLGYEVHALDLVKHNIRTLESKNTNIHTYVGNATNLSMFKDKSMDIVLLLGPLYHLISLDEKVKCINEAKRILKDDGTIFIQYCLNDYAIMKHGFIDKNITNSKDTIDYNYKINSKDTDLYSYMRISDIDNLNKLTNLKLIKRFTPEYLTDFFRRDINALDDYEFNKYLDYILSICEDSSLYGAGTHIVDILKK